MKNVLISGGTGLIGSALTQKLKAKGYQVSILTRSPKDVKDVDAYHWDPAKGEFDVEAFAEVNSIIHLAGAGIADENWSKDRKKIIIDSRVDSAKLLLRGVETKKPNLKSFISASGINYYGTETTDHIYTESDPASKDFIGVCCLQWEAAAELFKDHARVVKLRTGVVLSAKGGALERIAKPVRFGLGAALGSGKQYMPYLHIDDLCGMYIAAIENETISGAYNACNGDHITNKQLTESIADALGKPYWLPNVPAVMMKLAFGEMANILLNGSRASAEKIKNTGFEFRFKEIGETLKEIYG